MLHDMTFTETKSKDNSFVESNKGKRLQADPQFFRAKLCDGIIDVRACLASPSNFNLNKL